MTNEIWLMLAYPGNDIGRYSLRTFAPSRHGRSWYRQFHTRDAALASKAELAADGIPFKCFKAPPRVSDRPRPVPRRSYPGEGDLGEIDHRYLAPPRRLKMKRK